EAPDLGRSRAAVTRRPPFDFGTEQGSTALMRFFGTRTLDGFGLGDMSLGIGAAGALIAYLEETQVERLPHVRAIRRFARAASMVLDAATRASLELVAPLRGDGHGTPLLEVVDRTRTPMGARLLRQRLLAPL